MSTISRTVMRRVRIMHALRPLFSGSALALFALVAALWGIGREVWVARVLENASHVTTPVALERFAVAAFLNTGLVVQVLSVLTLFAAGWLVWDGIRSLRATRQLA